MKKSFSIYLFALLIITSLFAYMIYGQNTDTRENQANNKGNTSNTDIDIRDWKTYINDEIGLSIKYPDSWRMEKLPSFGVENALTGWSFIDESGPTMRYTFNLYWGNNQGYNNCEQFAEYRYQQGLADYLTDNPGASGEDEFAKGIRERIFPVAETTINNYPACRLPDLMAGDSHDEHYLIFHGDYVYGATFATAYSPAENILNPGKNNALAHEMLKTINFSN